MSLLLDTHIVLWWLNDIDLPEYLRTTQFAELPVTWHHGKLAGDLPRHHNDPFDRLLVAQAQGEELTLVTHDSAVRRYEVDVLPA